MFIAGIILIIFGVVLIPLSLIGNYLWIINLVLILTGTGLILGAWRIQEKRNGELAKSNLHTQNYCPSCMVNVAYENDFCPFCGTKLR